MSAYREPLQLKPKPLSPNAKFLDRVEYVLQWLVWLLIVYWPERPALSGLLTGLKISALLLIVSLVIMIVTGYFK